ncbi:MAG: pyridoxal phosphate-dependent aminotransferase [Eubacteriales bacterium]
MDSLTLKFSKLGVDNAPGQETLQKKITLDLRGEKLEGTPVDFSHGDVDAFQPLPGSFEAFDEGFHLGASQAYTEYRGKASLRMELAEKLSAFTGSSIDATTNLIMTPGTQGALFLAVASMIVSGDKVAIVDPDYFANRKLVEFFDCTPVPIKMNYMDANKSAGIDLTQLEEAFKQGVKLFLFSNPNNPTGSVYSSAEVKKIASLAKEYHVSLIVDELYSRQIFSGNDYAHLCALEELPEEMVTIIGPSKTESLSGFRLGVAFGSETVITRMEKLQAIVSLRCAGYCQAAFKTWFSEPTGFMADRIAKHEAIRDDLVTVLEKVSGVTVRPTDAGSYLFPQLPELEVSMSDFAKIVRQLADVTITPGSEFGATCHNSFRVNFSQDHKAAVAAMERLLVIMERYRK